MKFLILILLVMGCAHKPSSSMKEAASLQFAQDKVEIKAFWKSTPEVEPEQFLRLEVRDLVSGELVKAPAEISVSVWTKTHSYGLVEPTVVPTSELGVYDVSGIYFLAKGKWEVRVYLNQGADSKPMQKFLVDLGEEALNPIDDPNSPMYKMMKGSGMDHKNMNHGAPASAPKGSTTAP